MDISLFDFDLPEELIAQAPSRERDGCRLLAVDRFHRTYEDKTFRDILSYLRPGDVLVRNNTRVIPARLIGEKDTGGRIELLLLKDLGDDVWECLVGNAHSVRVGSLSSFGNGKIKARCEAVLPEGIRHMRFLYEGIFLERLEELGEMPFPPYIRERTSRKEDYQTVYAKVPGSAAAPTAGFHFTPELLDEISSMGVEILDLTLDIGLGTFRPVKVQDTKEHRMHEETYSMGEETAKRLNLARKEGRRIVAVGTTSVRTLEAVYGKYGEFRPESSSTSIFIEPGYRFQAVDALITNFHLPKSTLVMLVSAFMGREFTLECYRHAVEERYRFFSFGDAMFIHGAIPEGGLR